VIDAIECPVLSECSSYALNFAGSAKRFPPGDFFIAAIPPESYGKTHGATDIMARDRIVREGVRGVTWL
jgi:hypothetical protein